MIAERNRPTAPRVRREEVQPLLPGIDLWDLWPVQTPDGAVAEIDGGSLWMLLSAEARPDPDARHAHARIRLMHRTQQGWRDLGPALPDGFAPGSREWAGSAVLWEDGRRLTLYFTAAGQRGERELSFDQRLVETSGTLRHVEGGLEIEGWTKPVESVVADGALYTRDMAGGGAIGTIKAFRDPSYFRDPADGREYLIFTASLAASSSSWNGAVGAALRMAGRWELQPPIIHADGLNNELERPHIVVHQGRYYLFWSTQTKVFADDGPAGPNGLYGMVADRFGDVWRPLNGTGLVLANPVEAPFQAYSWLVLDDLSVVSFLDVVGLDRLPRDAAEARAHFGGTPAAPVQLGLAGDCSWVAPIKPLAHADRANAMIA